MIDHDLQFENDFRHGDPVILRSYFGNAQGKGPLLPRATTERGYAFNPREVGPAILWSPFFLAAHAAAKTGRALGADVQVDGYSTAYKWLTAFGSALYAFLGLLLSHRVARSLFGDGPALVATVAVWGASSLPVYMYFLPFSAFAPTVAVAALFLLVWTREGWGLRRWLALGLLGGLLPVMHPVAIAWLALPALSLAGLERGRFGERVRAGCVFAAGGFLAITPQLAASWVIFGTPFARSQVDQFAPFRPELFRFLFGARHGLISWTPIAGIALVGLVLVLRRGRRLGVGLLVVFAAMLYIVAAHTTSEASSYGNRFFVLFTPAFVLGAAAIIEAAWKRRRRLVLAVATLAIVWNLMFAFQWAWGLIPKQGSVEWGTVVRNQFTTAPRELAKAVHWFVTDRQRLIQYVQDQDLRRRAENRA